MERGEPGKLFYILHSWRARWFNWIFICRTTHCRILTKSWGNCLTAELSLTVSRPKPLTLPRYSRCLILVVLPDLSSIYIFFPGNVPSLYWFKNNFTYNSLPSPNRDDIIEYIWYMPEKCPGFYFWLFSSNLISIWQWYLISHIQLSHLFHF